MPNQLRDETEIRARTVALKFIIREDLFIRGVIITFIKLGDKKSSYNKQFTIAVKSLSFITFCLISRIDRIF